MARRRKYYAMTMMTLIMIIAVILEITGFVLRRTTVRDLPEYADSPDIAIPLMLVNDSSPVRRAREAEAWEAQMGDDLDSLELFGTGSTLSAAQPAAVEAHAPQQVPAAEEQPSQVSANAGDVSQVSVDPQPAAVEAAAPQDAGPSVQEAAAPQSVESSIQEAAPQQEAAGSLQPVAGQDIPAPAAASAPVVVDEHYFDHTLFIGDSKTDGMRMWARLGEAHYFCGTNYSVFNIFDKRATDKAFEDATLEEVLSRFEYDQIYVLLGYNESGYPYNSLMKRYASVLGRVHEAQPQARIILHGVMHASKKVARRESYYSVENLEKINSGLKTLVERYPGILYYVDCNGPFCDAEGNLREEVSNDGEHLTSDYVRQWAQEILKRAVVPQ